MKRVTLKDLAEEVGVSQNTVSLVLRGRPGISETTRELVLQKAKKMGYHERQKNVNMPNVCVLTTYKNNIDSYYFGRLQNRIEYYLNQNQCPTITVNNVETYSIEAIQDLCKANEMEGVIVVADVGRQMMETLNDLNIPILCAGFYVPGMNVDSVLEDNVVGMSLLMSKLSERGIGNAGFIGSIYTDQGFFERWMTTVAMGIKLNIKLRPEHCIVHMNYEKLGNLQEMAMVLEGLTELPEVFICANDKIAMTVIKALQQNGKRVPEDISVVGFDNCDLAPLSTPTIATVDNFLDEQARSAVSRLLRRLKEPNLPYERILCATQYVDGDSLRRNLIQ